jgi:hypothetical protein
MMPITSSISGAAYDKIAVYLGFNPELRSGDATIAVHLLVEKYRVAADGTVERDHGPHLVRIDETSDNPNIVALRAAVETALQTFITAEGM